MLSNSRFGGTASVPARGELLTMSRVLAAIAITNTNSWTSINTALIPHLTKMIILINRGKVVSHRITQSGNPMVLARYYQHQHQILVSIPRVLAIRSLSPCKGLSRKRIHHSGRPWLGSWRRAGISPQVPMASPLRTLNTARVTVTLPSLGSDRASAIKIKVSKIRSHQSQQL
jgi:hypothetical protein